MNMSKRMILTVFLFFPLALLLSGCSGGVNGEGSNTYALTQGTPVVRSDNFNEQGWALIGKGQYESAISKFNTVLSDSPNQDEMIEAYNGLGWARSNMGALHDGMPWFEKAAGSSDDAKVGLAAGYIQQGSKADLEKAYDLLYKQLGKENPHFNYVPRHQTGVTNAEAHALLAYACAGLGKLAEASAQMDYARELNPQYVGTTIEQIGKMIDFLNR